MIWPYVVNFQTKYPVGWRGLYSLSVELDESIYRLYYECIVLAHGLTVAFFNLQKLKKSTFSRLYTLWSCKFIIQNSLYSVLDKNTKNSSWSVNSVVFLLPKFVQFIFFFPSMRNKVFCTKSLHGHIVYGWLHRGFCFEFFKRF
jgi:hypothetical protein